MRRNGHRAGRRIPAPDTAEGLGDPRGQRLGTVGQRAALPERDAARAALGSRAGRFHRADEPARPHGHCRRSGHDPAAQRAGAHRDRALPGARCPHDAGWARDHAHRASGAQAARVRRIGLTSRVCQHVDGRRSGRGRAGGVSGPLLVRSARSHRARAARRFGRSRRIDHDREGLGSARRASRRRPVCSTSCACGWLSMRVGSRWCTRSRGSSLQRARGAEWWTTEPP